MKANVTFDQQFGSLDSAACGLSLDERFSDLIKEYEQQCRVGGVCVCVCVCVCVRWFNSNLDFRFYNARLIRCKML